MPKNNEICISRQKRFYKVGFWYLEYSSRNSGFRDHQLEISILEQKFSNRCFSNITEMVENDQKVASMKNQLIFAHEISTFFQKNFIKPKFDCERREKSQFSKKSKFSSHFIFERQYRNSLQRKILKISKNRKIEIEFCKMSEGIGNVTCDM